MKIETLQRAIAINNRIKRLKELMNCFEWKFNDEDDAMSTNPKLAIEFDDEDNGRELLIMPNIMNDEFMPLVKKEIELELKKAVQELSSCSDEA